MLHTTYSLATRTTKSTEQLYIQGKSYMKQPYIIYNMHFRQCNIFNPPKSYNKPVRTYYIFKCNLFQSIHCVSCVFISHLLVCIIYIYLFCVLKRCALCVNRKGESYLVRKLCAAQSIHYHI